jgi:paraquat-inducible protein A
MNKENTTLFKFYEKKGIIITSLLCISLIFNILALTTPFVTITQAFVNTLSYTLPYSIVMMWQDKLYVVAVLILVFSIIFPFVKLVLLSYIWFLCKDDRKRVRFIHIIEPLGKWSMLDVFIICIMLVLTNKQFLIGGKSEIGVIFFLIAILLSMTASHLIRILLIKI